MNFTPSSSVFGVDFQLPTMIGAARFVIMIRKSISRESFSGI
jgi:hypothetical protein